MKHKFYVDTHKGVTGLAVLLMIAVHDQWHNPTAWVYLALHGTYGILWVLKSRVFPDQQWERRVGLAFGLVSWGALALYWIAPWIITSQSVQAPPWFLGACVSLYAFGVFLHFASDMQKHVFLTLNPNRLITNGLWSRVRNPNYLGELLIYFGFGLLAMHWMPLAVIGLFIVFVWLPNMRRKDQSLSRYPEFAAYQTRTKWLIPFLL